MLSNEVDGSLIRNVTVLNQHGAIVSYQSLINSGELLDISDLPSGLYYLKYYYNNKVEHIQFKKKN